MKLLHLLLLSLHIVWVLGESCFLADHEKKDVEKLAVPHIVLTSFVIVICNLLTTIMFLVAGYLIAGYHFYEQILHDIEDDIELHERDERIKVQMAEQDLLWQMHRAKQERKAKQLEKLKEKEAEVKQAWKHDKDKMSEQIKASASRIAELEDELKKAEKEEKRKKRISKIKVTKKTHKLEQGQKLLSGCENPITPPPNGPAEPPPQKQPQAQAITSKETPEASAEQNPPPRARTFTIIGEPNLRTHEKVQEPLTKVTDTSKAKTPKQKRPSKEADARMTSESKKESRKTKSQKSKKSDRSSKSKRSKKSSKRSKRSEDDSETSKGSSKSIKQNRKANNGGNSD